MLLGAAKVAEAGVAFSSAADARTKMTSMLGGYVSKMESSYVDMASEEGGSCPYVPSCDPAKKCTSTSSSSNALGYAGCALCLLF